MLFGGEFSHAIVKRPKAGDFRVQPHLGGSEAKLRRPPGGDRARQGGAGRGTGRSRLRPGRHDPRRVGTLSIIELELIEPALWLQHAPDAAPLSPPRS